LSLLFTNITIVITTSAQLPRPVRSGVTKKTLVARPVRSGTYPVSASRALARAQMRARPPPERRVQREREGQWGEGVHVGCCGDQSSEDGRSNGPTRGAEPTAIYAFVHQHPLIRPVSTSAHVIAGKSFTRASGRRVQREREDRGGGGCCGDQSSENKRSDGPPNRETESTGICICSRTSSYTNRFRARASSRASPPSGRPGVAFRASARISGGWGSVVAVTGLPRTSDSIVHHKSRANG